MPFALKTLTFMTVSALALSACASLPSFNREAGAGLDEGAFGNPTLHNRLIMTGELSYVQNLNERFAREVPTTINFAFNSAALTPETRAVLAQQARWIAQFPEVRFSVYGHTDLVGSDASNLRLGRRRAQAAVNYLVSQGISRNRLEALVSFGERQPLVATENREVRNRRTVTEVTGFLQNDPLVLDGRYADIVYRTYTGAGNTAGGG